MMATATSPHSSLHLSRESYGPTLNCYQMETPPSSACSSTSSAAIMRVKRQRRSPPRLPAPPPPTQQSSEELEILAAPPRSQVGPLRDCEDELATLKRLMISPHMIQQEGGVQSTPPSVHQLNTGRHDETPPSMATSPSPLPLPEPQSETEESEASTSPGLTRFALLENLAECEDKEWTGGPQEGRRDGITREQLNRGGVYGGLEEEEGTMSSSLPVTSGHRPVTRQHPFMAAGRRNEVGVVSMSPPMHEERRDVLLCPDQEPQLLLKTRPVPPPRYQTTSPPPHTSPHPHTSSTRHTRVLQSTLSSPALFSSEITRSHSISFLQCEAGDDLGSFPADYLGSKEIDTYNNCVNTVAKQLVDSKPIEVVTYVTSKKIRLAPPRNAALLFKSFAVRDILAVEMCSKNKRIVGILVWKRAQSRVPVCHVLRCQSSMVSNGLYEALLFQTQQVDEVPQEKVQQPVLDSPDEPPLGDDFAPIPRSPPTPRSHAHQQLPSPTDLLHKLPAVYVGGAGAGKLHSVSEVIDKVLSERRPSQSREVGVWLSLSQVQLVQTSEGGREEVCAAHETSRIRAIGVCSRDKRYMGYIIKEEGKPLTGHVLHCTSAALMVSLMSFLRQSCQLMVYQRGGSFYDELSDDDSDDYDTSPPCMEGSTHTDSSKFLKRFRSLTMSLSNRHTVSPPTPTRPSFQSHTYLHKQLSPANDVPPKKRDAIQNPLLVSPRNITEEDYARFTVCYVGSASLYLPFTRDSVLDALQAFEEGGVAAGQAAFSKNSIEMQVSALSVSLTDKSHKLFVTRNYPRKQIQGFCVHPSNAKYLALATQRPGFPTSIKVHVFVHGEEPSSQIIDSFKYWLEMESTAG